MRNGVRLALSDGVVVAAALLLVPIAAASSRLVPLPRAVSIMCRLARCLPMAGVRSCPSTFHVEVQELTPTARIVTTARIVNGAALRVGARCLTRALVLNAVLSRTGIRSQVVVGASSHGGQLKSHAWVERDGESLLGPTAGWTPIWRSAS
jgi:hypothetical protein